MVRMPSQWPERKQVPSASWLEKRRPVLRATFLAICSAL